MKPGARNTQDTLYRIRPMMSILGREMFFSTFSPNREWKWVPSVASQIASRKLVLTGRFEMKQNSSLSFWPVMEKCC